jgi:hypothetical protein
VRLSAKFPLNGGQVLEHFFSADNVVQLTPGASIEWDQKNDTICFWLDDCTRMRSASGDDKLYFSEMNMTLFAMLASCTAYMHGLKLERIEYFKFSVTFVFA